MIIIKDHAISVTDAYEENKEVVKEFFASGMDYDDFIRVMTQSSNYIEKAGKYEKLSINTDKSLRYSQIEELLFNLNKSEIVKLEKIGTSHDKRDLYSLEIGSGEKVMLLDGGLHAKEVSGTYCAMMFAINLVNKWEQKENEIVSLFKKVKLVIVPCSNPDGFEMTQFGIDAIKDTSLYVHSIKGEVDHSKLKSNANGVDLNRNFPTQNSGLYYTDYEDLKSNVSRVKTSSIYTYFNGYAMGSEPETQALIYWFGKFYKKAYVYVNLHSQGRVMFVGKPNLSDEYNALCVEQAKRVASATDYKIYGLDAEEVGEGNDGTISDFTAELASGFEFSKKTLRLSQGNYKDKATKVPYKFGTIVIETLDCHTQDPNVIKTEYINKNLEKAFMNLLDLGL